MGVEPTPSAWKAEVLPLNYTRKIFYAHRQLWWRGKDSNLRRLSQQIYSLPPLATREPLQVVRILMEMYPYVNTQYTKTSFNSVLYF